MRKSVLLWVLMVPTLSLYTMVIGLMRVGLVLGSLLCIKAFLIITQDCIRDSEQVL